MMHLRRRGTGGCRVAADRRLDLRQLFPKVGQLQIDGTARGQLGELSSGVAQQLPNPGVGLHAGEQIGFLGEPVVLDDLVISRLRT